MVPLGLLVPEDDNITRYEVSFNLGPLGAPLEKLQVLVPPSSPEGVAEMQHSTPPLASVG